MNELTVESLARRVEALERVVFGAEREEAHRAEPVEPDEPALVAPVSDPYRAEAQL